VQILGQESRLSTISTPAGFRPNALFSLACAADQADRIAVRIECRRSRKNVVPS
jgi:hypothetical protein